MSETLSSVGIDIGTSTTQVIFSRLEIENTSGFGAIPKIEIVSKDIIYESPVYLTPLKNDNEIDAQLVLEILRQEYARAGIEAKELATGAIIITGETVKKKNAGSTARQLSEIAGDFVVVTAGPDLESVLAGRGSGAAELSKMCGGIVVNLDIGGGTTNICVFDNGEVIDTACLDIGGRLLKIENDKVVYLAESLQQICTSIHSNISVGDRVSIEMLRPVLRRMASLLEEEMGFRSPTDLLPLIYTNHGLKKNYKPEHIVLSGGVAACLQRLDCDEEYVTDNPFAFHDIGVLLAREIKDTLIYEENDQFVQKKLLPGKETLRATVIGAGNYAVHISGSTVAYYCCDFPYKNIPVVRIPLHDTSQIASIKKELNNQIKIIFEQEENIPLFAISFAGIICPDFYEIEEMAGQFYQVYKEYSLGSANRPIILIMEEDHGKSLGQALRRKTGKNVSILSVDCINCKNGDYIDIGNPVSNGSVFPIVVKTLIFE